MKQKKVPRKPKTSGKKAPKKEPLEELRPQDLERVAGGYTGYQWLPPRRIIRRFR